MEKLTPRTLPHWDELPDFELYMDQILSLMERYLGPPVATGEKGLTASMVNNYVKLGLVPSPRKKRYDREHLSCLVMVCALKTVLPLAAIQRILADGEEEDPSVRYNRFCDQFEAAEQDALRGFVQGGESDSPHRAAVAAALGAQAQRNVALKCCAALQ